MVRINKQGQSGGNAAILVIIITVLIVLYILFLPPADRAALLEENNGSATTAGATQILLKETPGQLNYVASDSKEYDFSSFTVSTEVRGEALASRSSLYVKNSVFEKKEDAIQFSVNPALAKNVLLSFNIDKMEGTLHVTLNGQTILSSQLPTGNSPAISIDSSLLKENNEIRFSVSSPGVAFWRYNEYSLSNVKIFADVKDESQSQNTQTLLLTADDLKNLKGAQIRYAPVCRTGQVSNLDISLNGASVFNGIPSCGTYVYIPVAAELLVQGTNRITFKISEGSLLIDRMRLTSSYETENNPIYYFEMDDANFTNPNANEDFVQNPAFDAFMDIYFPNTLQKRFEIYINGKKVGFNTMKNLETRQIDNYLRPGTNSIEIKPLQDMTITELRIRLKRV